MDDYNTFASTPTPLPHAPNIEGEFSEQLNIFAAGWLGSRVGTSRCGHGKAWPRDGGVTEDCGGGGARQSDRGAQEGRQGQGVRGWWWRGCRGHGRNSVIMVVREVTHALPGHSCFLLLQWSWLCLTSTPCPTLQYVWLRVVATEYYRCSSKPKHDDS